MTPHPVPGLTEAELVAKVGSSVVQGLRAASQPSLWPDAREALLELHAILHEWVERSEATTRYAETLASRRRTGVIVSDSVNRAGAGAGAGTNVGPMYVEHAALDTRNVLQGKVPPVQRLRGSSSRRAARRGLRTILAAYCPALLEQFESATASRSNWVSEHRKDFERSFGQSRTDAQVAQLMSSMKATHAALAEAERQLAEFIRASFPLPGATSGG
jgi:hypothetical protein